MSQKKSNTRRAAGKVAQLPEVTPEQVRAVLGGAKVKASARRRLYNLVAELHNHAAGGTLSDSPDITAAVFAQIAPVVKGEMVGGPDNPAEARATYEQIAQLIAEHEPEEHRIARRCVEINDANLERDAGVGANFFTEHTDEVLNQAFGALFAPSSQFFVPVFTAAVRKIGHGHPAYVALKELISKVDAGADLAELFVQYEAEHATRDAERERKQRDAPEPADRLSTEWRVWKLGRMSAALRGDDDEARRHALGEFLAFLAVFTDEENIGTAEAISLLPRLIEAWQKRQQKRGAKRQKGGE